MTAKELFGVLRHMAQHRWSASLRARRCLLALTRRVRTRRNTPYQRSNQLQKFIGAAEVHMSLTRSGLSTPFSDGRIS